MLGSRMADQSDSPNSPLAFQNPNFLNSPGARALRILSEYLEPAERLRKARIHDTIVFFGSARAPSPADLADGAPHSEQDAKLARYYQDAEDLSRRLTEWSKSLTGHHDFIIC